MPIETNENTKGGPKHWEVFERKIGTLGMAKFSPFKIRARFEGVSAGFVAHRLKWHARSDAHLHLTPSIPQHALFRKPLFAEIETRRVRRAETAKTYRNEGEHQR